MEDKTLLVGEPMGLFIARNVCELEDVRDYTFAIAGAELNVGIGLRRLGHSVGYYTKLGNDLFGRAVIKNMKRNGIDTDLITYSSDHMTGFMMKSSVVSGDPAVCYFRKGSAASTISPDDIRRLNIREYSSVHITGITPALSVSAREATTELALVAKKQNLQLSFDPNLRPQLWPTQEIMRSYINDLAFGSDIFLPGQNEAQLLIGTKVPEEIAEYYLSRGTKLVVVKLGSKGAYFASPTESAYVPGFGVERIVDTVGAGDGFAAGLLSGLQEGLSLYDAVMRGNAIGAIQVSSLGDNDGLPTREELFSFMRGEQNWRLHDE